MRARPYGLATFYAALALVWLAFARKLAPPFMGMQNPGEPWATIQRLIKPLPSLVLTQDLPGCWREFSDAVLIAGLMHFTIVMILRGYDRRAALDRSLADFRGERLMSLWLAFLALSFLVVPILTGAIHDYYFYPQMWYEVRAGHDPWFIVNGVHGVGPLNAYGPLFNTMASLVAFNPLAPKLLFCYAYALFAIVQIKSFTSNRPATVGQSVLLTLLFWSPYPWVEIAIQGHFDILVALCTLGSVRAWVRGRDTASAFCLAGGVLLKFQPIVLLPFLAFDRRRVRGRFVAIAVASMSIGMGVSYALWGPSILAPLEFAARRRSVHLSIFAFVSRRFCMLPPFIYPTNLDELSPILMLLFLFWVWTWYWRWRPGIEAAAPVAAMIMVLFHRTGFPQYHMVPIVLGTGWAIRHWPDLSARPSSMIAIGSYLTWMAGFDVYYALTGDGHPVAYWMNARDIVGLPAFVFEWAFIVGIVGAASADDARVARELSSETTSSGT